MRASASWGLRALLIFVLTSSVGAGDLTVDGEVIAIDSSAIAFDGPVLVEIDDLERGIIIIEVLSMGLLLCAASPSMADVHRINVGDLVNARGAYDADRLRPCESADHFLRAYRAYTNGDFGIQFTYPTLPNGYVLQPRTADNDPTHQFALDLFRESEWQEFQRATEAREGPPAISIDVYTNVKRQWSGLWAETHPELSHVSRIMSDIEYVVIGGANAVNYFADGLFPLDTFVVANGDHVFVLTAMIPDASDAIATDFKELIASLEFPQSD